MSRRPSKNGTASSCACRPNADSRFGIFAPDRRMNEIEDEMPGAELIVYTLPQLEKDVEG
jgi:hypothetical protein